ncbi:MAG: class I SAM-dependent methyltransferase [Kiritimatiellales bacterium]
MNFKHNTDKSSARYWNDLAEIYQRETRISTNDFHYGPLICGDSVLNLLPPVENRRCLEIGCGAGQNSIFLTKCNAECVAIDISQKQLAAGRKIAGAENVNVDFRCMSMDLLSENLGNKPVFDFIHSTYALPFAANPVKVIADAAALLKSGGVFLLTTGHPLYAGEWLEIGDDDEDGLFMPDYFHPEADVRMSLDDQTMTAAHYHPLAAVRIDS